MRSFHHFKITAPKLVKSIAPVVITIAVILITINKILQHSGKWEGIREDDNSDNNNDDFFITFHKKITLY